MCACVCIYVCLYVYIYNIYIYIYIYIVYINLELCNEGLEPLVRLLLRMWSDKSLFFSFFFFPFSFLANVHLLYIDIITWGVRSAISFFLFFPFFFFSFKKQISIFPSLLFFLPKKGYDIRLEHTCSTIQTSPLPPTLLYTLFFFFFFSSSPFFLHKETN